MKNLLRKLHIGGNHDDQVDAGRIIEGRSYEGSGGSNAGPRGSLTGAASAPAASSSPTSANTVSAPPEHKPSGLTTFLNAVGSAVGRVGQSNSSNNNQVTTGGQVRQRLENSGGSGGDADLQTSKVSSKKRTPSLGGGDSNQVDLNSLQILQSEEEYQVQIAMALSVSNSYISPSVANEAEKAQIEVAKRISLGLSPSSGNSQADIVSYRYWACNMVDYDEIVPDGFYDVNGVLSESHLSERMPSLKDLTRMPISETSKIEAVLVNRELDPDLVSLEERVSNLSANHESGEAGLPKTELAQKIALIVVEQMGGPVGSDTEMLTRWRKASWDVKNSMQNVVLTLGCLSIGLTRHRALLFKVLADRVRLPCQLVKGRHYPGVEEEGAVNIVRVDDNREYIIDLMGAPGALIPPDKPQIAQTGNTSELGSSTDVSPKSAKTEQSYASIGGSSCGSPSGSMHSTRSTPESRDVNKDKEMNYKKGTGETQESKSNNVKLDGRHHSEPGELAGLSARPSRLHARSPSWTEGMLDKRQMAGGRPLKDVSQIMLGVAKEHPQLAQKLHDVLLESGVAPPPDLLAEISPKQLQASVMEEKKVVMESQLALPALPVKKKGPAVRGRPPAGVHKSSQQVVDEGSNSKDRLQRLNSVEGLGERRPLGGSQTNLPSTPAIVPLVVIPPVAQEGYLQQDMMRHVPVAAAAAATAAVVATTMVAAAGKVDGSDGNLEVPMAAAATATAAVVAATSAAAGRRVDSNEASPHNSNEREREREREREKEKDGSGRRRTHFDDSERVERAERGSGGGRRRHSGDKRSDETDASSPGNSDGRGGSDGKANSSFGDGLDGEVSVEEERNADGLSGPQQKRIDSVLKDVAEWEIPWEDIIIGERIGLGSYGEVYRGDWHGSEVAVKKFLDQDLSGDALEEFRLEVRIMRRLRHPNVVLFMGAVTRPPHLSIVTEFLPRGSLYRLIHRPNNQLDERRRLRMALDVAKGMNYLHSSSPLIVHRDLKSPNLLVDKNWVVKVCDFGLSRMKHNTFLSSKSTAGTPEWMAPEMLRNEPSNEKCDVYSFGVILWELATLRQPWAGMNPMQVVGAVGFQHRRLDIPPDMDPQLAGIIRECWQNDPNMRPSFAQLMAALRPLQRPLPAATLAAQQENQRQVQAQNATIQPAQQPQVTPQQQQSESQQPKAS
ncbi:sterile alpha motif and leucine zipper containing kinase AZK [Marchantia polymorpha subsp. ruderalis]